MKKYYLVLLICYLIVGCNQTVPLPTVESVIKENSRLKEVLEYYATDSLKLEAARFLIKNLPFYYSYEGEGVENYLKHFEIYSTGLYTPQEVLDFVKGLYGPFSYQKISVRMDTEIEPKYLIENIEWAFKVWQEQPWGKHIPFDGFCEYILPYRVGNERLVSWREELYNQFNPLLDEIRDLPEAEDPFFVAQILLKVLQSEFHFTESFSFGPHVGPQIVQWRSGNCRESTDLLTYVFRAVGIPCGCDMMLLRGDGNVGHYWNFILDKKGDSYYCSPTYNKEGVEKTNTYWAPKSKIYRNLFSRNQEMWDALGKQVSHVHPSFRDPNIQDVTVLYSGKNRQVVEIPKDSLYRKLHKDEIVYLCSSARMDWQPQAWTYAGKEDIRFEDVEGNVIFCLAVYKDNKIFLVSDPFLLFKDNGDIHFFDTKKGSEEIVLFHKYHQNYEGFTERMEGGVFEGSNLADFRDRDTLFIIEKMPARLEYTVMVHSSKPYRYVRYKGPDGSHCNVSEVAFYETWEDDIPLTGKVIGTSNSKHWGASHDYTNVFDGDPYTSFDYYLPDGGWAGLDLETPKQIGKIVCTPRNRDNYIRKGDKYELFYSSVDGWVSLGSQIAKSDSLLYTAPVNTLLYLKNHTRGKDERIFEILNGEQKYW